VNKNLSHFLVVLMVLKMLSENEKIVTLDFLNMNFYHLKFAILHALLNVHIGCIRPVSDGFVSAAKQAPPRPWQ